MLVAWAKNDNIINSEEVDDDHTDMISEEWK